MTTCNQHTLHDRCPVNGLQRGDTRNDPSSTSPRRNGGCGRSLNAPCSHQAPCLVLDICREGKEGEGHQD